MALVRQGDDRQRPQDAADLRAPFDIATEPEIERARAGVAAIARGGFARGRDLEAAIAEWLANVRA